MGLSRSADVLIAGAGPAGLATALYLLKARPDLAGKIVALEKSQHPRFKVCAGGLIPKTLLALDKLGIALDVPHVDVRNGVARTELGDVEYPGGQILCSIIRRNEFDALLARVAREAGLEIVENCRASEISNSSDGVSVRTEKGDFRATLLVGADGSGSVVRDAVFPRRKDLIGRALMTDVEVDSHLAREFTNELYRFDFRCVSAGIKGYSWSFPCLIDARPHLNVGIYDQCPRETVSPISAKPNLFDELVRAFPDLPISGRAKHAFGFKAFPIRWYAADQPFSAGRVLLAGDAAGVDPLMGEGISCAFEHGKLAAAAILQFLDGQTEALKSYDNVLHRGAIGRKLSKLAFAARHFYGPRHRLFFRLAHLSRNAQQIGVDWYNGHSHSDELPTRTLVARWTRSVLFGSPMR
jgi:flavin-dependent dehydrogenase